MSASGKPDRHTGYLLAAVLLTAVLSLCAFLAVRNLGGLVRMLTGEDSSIARVFGQLKEASVRPPVLIPLAVWFAYFALCIHRRWKRPAVVIFSVLLWVILLLLTLWFTRVNGIRFGSVVRSLLRYISNGLLDQL